MQDKRLLRKSLNELREGRHFAIAGQFEPRQLRRLAQIHVEMDNAERNGKEWLGALRDALDAHPKRERHFFDIARLAAMRGKKVTPLVENVNKLYSSGMGKETRLLVEETVYKGFDADQAASSYLALANIGSKNKLEGFSAHCRTLWQKACEKGQPPGKVLAALHYAVTEHPEHATDFAELAETLLEHPANNTAKSLKVVASSLYRHPADLIFSAADEAIREKQKLIPFFRRKKLSGEMEPERE